MTKEQHKYCTAMVRALKRHRDSGPFLKPVDIVALNIPDYPNIVKHPMDMDTVEKTLKARQYTDTQAFSDDLRLMFNNCYMYNGRESVVGIMAGNIENMFESQLKKMPTGIDTALAEHNRRESEAGMRTPTSANRPKRDAHPPPSRDLPNMQRKKSRTTDPQMKHCLNIVKDFMKKANFNIAYPFLEPVDPIGMNCPDYFSVVKEPMDLLTIKNRLESDEYASPLEFESDVRLMLRNCYAYNPPGHPVHEAGRALEARFDIKWTELPVPRASQSPTSYSGGGTAIPHSPPVGGEDEFDKHVYGVDDEIDIDTRSQGSNTDEIRDLELKVQTMARQLQELKRGDSTVRRPSSVRRPSMGSVRSATASPPPPHSASAGS
ncbi:transcription initiation at TATA-containing promoter protein, partial [Coemansia sp. RSA 1287]